MKYEDIRRRLIKVFAWRGFNDAEGLADETINRVTEKVMELQSSYVGDPVSYFYGVAKMVMREQSKKESELLHAGRLADTVVAHDVSSDEFNILYEALDKCIGNLPKDDRKLILEYYEYRKMEKVNHRKDMAKKLNITPAALRKRAQRIREHLHECMERELAKRVPGY